MWVFNFLRTFTSESTVDILSSNIPRYTEPSTRRPIMPNRLEGKSIAITGGDQGIGRAIAERLAQDGADIAICYRANQAGANEVVDAIKKLGRQAIAIQCDVGKIADGQRFIADAAQQLGKLDVLIQQRRPGASRRFLGRHRSGLRRCPERKSERPLLPHPGLRPPSPASQSRRQNHQHQLRPRRTSLSALLAPIAPARAA